MQLGDWRDLTAAAADSAPPCSSAPDLFFDTTPRAQMAAKRLCSGCDLRAMCGAVAIGNDERYGVWGGMASADGRSLDPADARRRRA